MLPEVIQKQLIVSSVVAGAPVIANQGELNGQYLWRVQIPFLVTYESAENVTSSKYTVILTITKVPTEINPTGIGIEQFLMV